MNSFAFNDRSEHSSMPSKFFLSYDFNDHIVCSYLIYLVSCGFVHSSFYLCRHMFLFVCFRLYFYNNYLRKSQRPLQRDYNLGRAKWDWIIPAIEYLTQMLVWFHTVEFMFIWLVWLRLLALTNKSQLSRERQVFQEENLPK